MKPKSTTGGYSELYRNLLSRILKGKGFSPQQQREAAFDNNGLPQPLHNLVDKIAHHAYKVTESDVDAVKRTGVSEDALFELIVCAAVGQASRQYESGLAALAEVVKEGGEYAS
jgi:alkylhydroperoxidase/carboxymuconolactone decarboxylase family protein YurZ